MKLSLSTLSCPSWGLGQIIRAAVDSGIGGIDFRGLGSDIDITGAEAFRGGLHATLKSLRGAGLEVPCLNTSVTLICPSSQRWEAMLAEASRYAELAEKMEAGFLRIFGGKVINGLSLEQGRMMAQRHLRQVVKICRSRGCLPLVETHDEWATSGAMLELIHDFDPAEMGVLWDLEHPWRAGELPMETALRLKAYIRHVHVKDSIIVQGKARPVLLGEGEVPLGDCAAALRGIEYEGWYCLESEKRWEPGAPEPEGSLPQFGRYMRARWGKKIPSGVASGRRSSA